MRIIIIMIDDNTLMCYHTINIVTNIVYYII